MTDPANLISLTECVRRTGKSWRWCRDNFSTIQIGGRSLVAADEVDRFLATRDDTSGLLSTREAQLLLGYKTPTGATTALRAAGVREVQVGPMLYWDAVGTLAVARERDQERRQRDARAARQVNRRRDRGAL